MKQMVFIEPGRLEWKDTPSPTIQGAGEAIVRPTLMGRCDLDVLYLSGRMPLASGEPIGHEIIGEIVDLGDAAGNDFYIGQSVIVSAQINCGTCRMCSLGETGRCQSVPFGASYGMGREGGYGGAVSELVRVPYASSMLVPIPSSADHSELMGLADMATDAWRAVGPQLERRPGASVLVIGGAVPVIGIYAAGIAQCSGAGRVVYLDKNESHRIAAAKYGVETASTIDEIDHASFDIVVDAASDKDAQLLAIKACAPAAYLCCVAPPLESHPLPMMEMYHKGLNYQIGRPNCRHGHNHGLEAWACKGFKPGLVGPKLFSFDDAITAWGDSALYVAVTSS